MEDSPLRVPYIEDEIWGSSPRTKLKEGISSKINFARSDLRYPIKALMIMHLVR